jgi:hypothetical protein
MPKTSPRQPRVIIAAHPIPETTPVELLVVAPLTPPSPEDARHTAPGTDLFMALRRLVLHQNKLAQQRRRLGDLWAWTHQRSPLTACRAYQRSSHVGRPPIPEGWPEGDRWARAIRKWIDAAQQHLDAGDLSAARKTEEYISTLVDGLRLRMQTAGLRAKPGRPPKDPDTPHRSTARLNPALARQAYQMHCHGEHWTAIARALLPDLQLTGEPKARNRIRSRVNSLIHRGRVLAES